MTMLKTGLPFTAAEQAQPKPIDKIIDAAIASQGYRRRPLTGGSTRVRPKLHQSYDSRSTSAHKAAYKRMVGSE